MRKGLLLSVALALAGAACLGWSNARATADIQKNAVYLLGFVWFFLSLQTLAVLGAVAIVRRARREHDAGPLPARVVRLTVGTLLLPTSLLLLLMVWAMVSNAVRY